MTLLPAALDDATYWRAVYAQPLPVWQAALDHICARHDLPPGAWQRFAFGRNVVFGCDEVVVKLSPPFWAADVPREAAALGFVHGKLPVVTPTLLAAGTLDGWGYLVQARLPGTLLRDLWAELTPPERAALARQHGRLMAAVHALPAADAPDALPLDWPTVLGAQWQACEAGLRQSGVPAPLLADAPAYLAGARDALFGAQPAVLLHGDLNFLNLHVARADDGWQIVGLLDWSDVALRPRAHELISPGVHMYRGDRALLRQWYAGYGLPVRQDSAGLQHEAMARAMLWYAAEFGPMLARVPGAAACTRWDAVAARFWQIGDGA